MEFAVNEESHAQAVVHCHDVVKDRRKTPVYGNGLQVCPGAAHLPYESSWLDTLRYGIAELARVGCLKHLKLVQGLSRQQGVLLYMHAVFAVCPNVDLTADVALFLTLKSLLRRTLPGKLGLGLGGADPPPPPLG